MELKQLQYLIAIAESKSLNQAAQKLYTSQPNLSKAISRLEQELAGDLLIRSSKGIRLTPLGEQVYAYGKNILKNAEMIRNLGEVNSYRNLKIASYPSNMISRNLADFYVGLQDDNLHIQFQEGTAEEVIQWVQGGQANIGILYIAKKQRSVLNQQLDSLQLTFQLLRECELCLYVGPQHPLYSEKYIDFEQLRELKLVQGLKNYFELEESVEWLSLGTVRTHELRHMVHTNSDHCILDMLLYTDLASLGLDFNKPDYRQYNIRTLRINNCESNIQIGYLTREALELQQHEELYMQSLFRLFNS